MMIYPWKDFENRKVTSDFIMEELAKRTNLPIHYATDYGLVVGIELMAIADCKVSATNAGDGAIYCDFLEPIDYDYSGKSIPLKGFAFVHCSKMNFSNGQTIKEGEVMALSGNTGLSTGPHLHLVIYDIDDQPVNPETVFGLIGALNAIKKLETDNQSYQELVRRLTGKKIPELKRKISMLEEMVADLESRNKSLAEELVECQKGLDGTSVKTLQSLLDKCRFEKNQIEKMNIFDFLIFKLKKK